VFSCLLVCLNFFSRPPSSLYLCLTLSVSASLPRCFGASLLCSLGTWLPSRIKCVCVFELCFSASSLIVHPLWFYFFLSCIIFSRFLVMLINHPSSPMYVSFAVAVIIFIASANISYIHMYLLVYRISMYSFSVPIIIWVLSFAPQVLLRSMPSWTALASFSRLLYR